MSTNKHYLYGEKAKNFSDIEANQKIFLKSKNNCPDLLNVTNENKPIESETLRLNCGNQKIDTFGTLSNGKFLQNTSSQAPFFRSYECPLLGHGPQKTQFSKANLLGRGEGPQNSEKVVKKLPKKIINTSEGKNPPHICNNKKDLMSKKEPGGGEDKMSVAFSSKGVKLKVNSSLCCGHKTLPKKPGQSKTIAPVHLNPVDDVSKKSPGGGWMLKSLAEMKL